MSARMAIVAIVIFSTCAWCGCGQRDPLNRQSVRGTVRFNGETLAKGTIRFVSTSKGPTRAGSNIADGSYWIPAEKGLAPGEYTVNIHIPDPNWDSKKALNPKELAPPEYTEGKHKITVTDGGSNVFDFDVKVQ